MAFASFEEYDRSEETDALLHIVSMGETEKARGGITPLAQATEDMRNAIFADRKWRLHSA